MQCPNRNYIYHINKKRLAMDFDYLNNKGLINIEHLKQIFKSESYEYIAELMTKSKEWVFFNRNPRYSKHNLQRKMAEMGYFDYDEVGCGKCEICKTERSKQWAVKAECEGRVWKLKTFLTLTYNGEHLPKNRKLDRTHMTKFWKRLRYHVEAGKFNIQQETIPTNPLLETFERRRKNKKPIRYIQCGEYGPKTKRPHYHAVVFNFKPDDLRRYSRDRRGYWLYTSKKINDIWGKGYVIIGNATTETAAYVARYCTKKYMKTEEEIIRMKNKKQLEYITASSLGFIGYPWFINHKDEIMRNNGIIMTTKKGTYLAMIPKVMRERLKREYPEWYDWYDYEKERVAKENWNLILSRTNLPEKEYILTTWKNRLAKLVKLRRDAN